MTWCTGCGEQYTGTEHACGSVTISKDRLRELERGQAPVRPIGSAPAIVDHVDARTTQPEH